MDLTVKIAEIYDGAPNVELSIREMATQLKATYSFVYKTVEKMAAEGVLIVTVKGRAKMCSLNLDSDKARALLTVVAVDKKEASLRKYRAAGQLLVEFVKGIAGEDVYCIVLFGSYAKGLAAEKSDIDLLIVGNSRAVLTDRVNREANTLQMRYGKDINPIVLDRKMFVESLRQEDVTVVKETLANHVILFGFERFWELVRRSLK